MPRLFLGNLGHDCRQKDIERLFQGYGELRNINIKVLNLQTNVKFIFEFVLTIAI